MAKVIEHKFTETEVRRYAAIFYAVVVTLYAAIMFVKFGM